jgi:FkbM family methyltransferase
MRLKTKILNKLRTVGLLSPVESALVRLSLNKTAGNVFAKIAPNNYQYPKNTIRECERDGIRYSLDISDYMQYCIYYGIEIEPRETLYSLVRNGTTVIDVGTNIGETLLNFAKINRDGRNIGFEPVPYLYEKAKANIGLNKFENIELISKGLSSSNETLSFSKAEENNSGGIFLTRDNGSSADRLVEVVTLDDFVAENQVDDILLIKIDVEGFEMEVLKGASQVLDRWKPILFVEVDDEFLERQQSSAQAVFDFLVSRGYSIKAANTSEFIDSASVIAGKHLDIVATAK